MKQYRDSAPGAPGLRAGGPTRTENGRLGRERRKTAPGRKLGRGLGGSRGRDRTSLGRDNSKYPELALGVLDKPATKHIRNRFSHANASTQPQNTSQN